MSSSHVSSDRTTMKLHTQQPLVPNTACERDSYNGSNECRSEALIHEKQSQATHQPALAQEDTQAPAFAAVWERAKCRHWLTRKHASRTDKSEHLIHLIIWIPRTRLGFPGQGIAGSTMCTYYSQELRQQRARCQDIREHSVVCDEFSRVWWLRYNKKVSGKNI